MAKTSHYYTQFEPGGFFHVYNRTVNKTSLFTKPENYSFFLKRYDKYLSSVLDTWSYALCGNHFHFGVKIRPEQDLLDFKQAFHLPKRVETPHQIVAHQFQSFFLSYAKAFNVQENRSGTLFHTPFKRCAVTSEDKLVRMIFYHHANPQKHRLCPDFRSYPWTSYTRYLLDRPTRLPREDVFELMGGRDKFIEYHNTLHKDLEDEDWFIEE